MRTPHRLAHPTATPLAVIPLAAALLLLPACGGLGVNVAQPVTVQTEEELPVAIERTIPVIMEGEMEVGIRGETPVRMLEPVPVTLSGPITLQIVFPTSQYEGVYISRELMDRIELGRATKDWILAVIGEPMHTALLDDGTEIWRWDYRPADPGPLVSLIPGDRERPQPMPITAYVRFRDGVVIEKWRG